MTSAFDSRIVQVSIQFPEGDVTFEGLSIYVTGQKFLAAAQNTCQCRISNLTKEQRNYILSRTSPLNIKLTPLPMVIRVGRESYGTFVLFNGYISMSKSTQPPDIGIVLTSLTNNFEIGNILADTQSPSTSMLAIAQNIARNNGLVLDFQATDKQISNFSYNGSAAYQINELNELGGIIAFIDNSVLTVLDAGMPNNKGSRLISADRGMVGIPEFTHAGVLVRMMVDNTVQLGNMITLQSEMLPAANGDYIIQKITFDIASRDQQFYYVLDCLAISKSPLAGTQ